jgi:transcriptional regulator with XRE-family HTH domain
VIDLSVAAPVCTPFTAQRRVLALLRGYREQHELTQDELAAIMDWSRSKIIRMEGGFHRIDLADVKNLMAHYELTPRTAEAVLALAREARRHGWWHPYSAHLSDAVHRMLDHEFSAVTVRQYQSARIPGLLQTGAYQLAVAELPLKRFSRGLSERIRVHRQRIVDEPAGRVLRFLLDEAVLWRSPAGLPAQIEQLDRLLTLAELDHLDIAVVPLDTGEYPRVVSGSLTLFDLPGADPLSADVDVVRSVWVPLGHPDIAHDPRSVEQARGILDSIHKVAVSGERCRALIERVRIRLAAGVGACPSAAG